MPPWCRAPLTRSGRQAPAPAVTWDGFLALIPASQGAVFCEARRRPLPTGPPPCRIAARPDTAMPVHSRPAARLRRLAHALAAALVATMFAAPAAAERLRIAASRTPVSLPLYVAAERGYFRDEG